VELWDWNRRTRLVTLQPGPSRVACVAFTADGKRLACGNYSGVIQIWDLTGGDDQPTVTIRQPGRFTLSIEFTADGQTLAAASWNDANLVRFWNTQTGEEIQSVEVNGKLRGLAYSPDGKFVAAGTTNTDRSLNLIDVATGDVRALSAKNCVVETLTFSPDGQKLFAGNWMGSIHVFDLPSADLVATLQGHSSVLTGITLSPDQQTFASCSHDRTIKLWDVAAARHPDTVAIGHESDAPWMQFSHDSKLLATSSFRASPSGPKGSLRLWDVSSGRLVDTCRDEGPGLVRSITFSTDDKRLAWTDGDSGRDSPGASTVVVRELATKRLQSLPDFDTRPLHMNFSSDSQHTLTSTTWRLKSGERISQEEIASVEFSPTDGPLPPGFPQFRHTSVGPDFYTRLSHNGRLFARGHGSSVQLWNLASGDLHLLDEGHSEFVFYVAFSRTDEILATCSQDKLICLWNTDTGELLQTLVGRTWPFVLAFSPDGATLASGDLDGMVTLWDLRTFTEILALEADHDIVTGLAFSSDGQTIACGTLGGKIHIWRAPRQ
jgi:WD40 repeat protein